ncbi:MAG: DUF481 domain-containing protein [Planctomycetota bacterium]
MILIPLVLGSGLVAATLTPEFAPLSSSATTALSTAAPVAQVSAPARPEADTDGWDGQFNVSASKTEGNTSFETYTVSVNAEQVVDIHRHNIDAVWLMSKDNQAASNRARRSVYGQYKYDQFFAQKTYFWVNARAESDQPSDPALTKLDLRWTVGGGLGHQFRDDAEWKINAEAGLAYFKEKYDGGLEQDYLAARVAWDVLFHASETTSLGHTGELYPSLETSDDMYGRADTFVDVKLSERMNARAQWILTWDNTPAPGRERSDNLYLLSIGWTF